MATYEPSGSFDSEARDKTASFSAQDDKSVVGGTPQPHFVQGMGLFSATAIVMGSMIGSGIFIVSADMSRVLGSPALLIAAWLVTAVMTVIGALSYGELAAMMPKAGGQYVYLRESLGPIWGFLYGWTLFLVIQTGTIAAVGVAFGKFLGVFFPEREPDELDLACGQRERRAEHGEPGGDCDDYAADVTNTRGVKLGAAVQNVFTSAKVLALLGMIAVGLVAKNAAAIAANFGAGWQQLLGGRGVACSASGGDRIVSGLGGGSALVGFFTVIAVVQVGCLFSSRCVEQRDVYGGRDSRTRSAICRCVWRLGRAWCCCCISRATLST